MNNADRPAYPISDSICQEAFDNAYGTMPHGLTKRERFAMAAMQGMLSNSLFYKDCIKLEDAGFDSDKELAQASVAMADNLLKALEE